MRHRTFNLLILAGCIASTVAILAMPADAVTGYGLTDAQMHARETARKERAAAQMCIAEHGAGVAVVWTNDGRAVCVPRSWK